MFRAVVGCAAACVSAASFAACAQGPTQAGSSSSTRPPPSTTKPLSLIPQVGTGQPMVTPGHEATRGPIGANPSTAQGITLTIVNGLLHNEPIFNGDFADPFALVDGDSVYAYATNTSGSANAAPAHIPVIAITRPTGFAGHYLGDAIPTLPRWTVSGYQWAPSVWARPDGTFVLYYSTPATHPLHCIAHPASAGCVRTTDGPNTAMCISRATSTDPAGPFVDNSSSAFICPYADGGAIDPSIFVTSNGTPWLLWKSNGDCCNLPTHIYSQQLSPDGLSVVGPPHMLIGATQRWEGNLVEAPSMVEEGNTFWLFYSANLWGTPNYSIGIAKCASIVGPCSKPLTRAWYKSTDSANGQGYGGTEFFRTGNLVWMVHHGLVPGQTGNYAQRRLYVNLLVFPLDGLPRIAANAPAAAVAEATLYDGDPSLPSQPSQAYLDLIENLSGSFSDTTDSAALGDGQLVCAGLARQESIPTILHTLQSRQLTDFESYVVSEFAARYLCPSELPQGISDMQQFLLQSSSG